MNSLDPFINKRVTVVSTDDTIYRASKIMCDQNIGCVPVVDAEENLVGMVTDRDIACAISSPGVSEDTQLEEIMGRQVAFASRNDSIEEVLNLMIDNSVRRIPIVTYTRDGNSRCTGFVTLDDLIATKAISIEEAAHVIGPQIAPRPRRIIRPLERSQAKREQTEVEFSKRIAKKTGLRKHDAREATLCFLETLFRRVSPGAANDLASQLPLRWKEYLSAFMTGPNKRVTPQELIENIAEAVNVPEWRAEQLAGLIYEALSDLTTGQALEHLKVQLPSKFHEVLEGRADADVSTCPHFLRLGIKCNNRDSGISAKAGLHVF